jgi:hypothetical protein
MAIPSTTSLMVNMRTCNKGHTTKGRSPTAASKTSVGKDFRQVHGLMREIGHHEHRPQGRRFRR